MVLTKKEKDALREIRKQNKIGCGIWIAAIEDYDIPKAILKSLLKKGKIYIQRSEDSGHKLIWVS